MSLKKSLTVLLLGGVLAVSSGAVVWAQEQRGTEASSAQRYAVDVRGWLLKDALEHLVDSTRISLVYDVAMVAGKRTACRAGEATAEALLRCILDQTGLEAERLPSDTFVLRPARASTPKAAASPANTVSGFVYDVESGDSLRDAAVYETAHRIGTTTDAAGHYRLRVPDDSARLAVSYLGYDQARLNLKLRGDVARDIGLDPAVLWMDSLRVVADRGEDAAEDIDSTRVLYQHVRGLHVGVQSLGIRSSGFAFVVGYRFKGKYDLGVALNENGPIVIFGPVVGYSSPLSRKGWGIRLMAAFGYDFKTFDSTRWRDRGFDVRGSVYRKYKMGKNTTVYPGVGAFGGLAWNGDTRVRAGGVQVSLPFLLRLKGKKKRGLVFEPIYRLGYTHAYSETFVILNRSYFELSFSLDMRINL